MAKLTYRTKGNSSPQGKERVFFTWHPEDFERCFETICEEIFETQNCAIWFDKAFADRWDEEQMDFELSRMQLFVIPVTTRFLYQKNVAREILFPFAVKHNIPVLPVMQERGLENDFNQICGDLQFLDKNESFGDSTVLPYEQKLERFLSSILLGDEQAEKVRKAFDAYIFLSYRKMDRKYAQELMRLIHRNEFCRDIAIWYDEFLVPGENFNHAIRDAMEKSELFTFAVTPNLLEQDNYVMSVEYPTARETGKPILPVEMVSTDLEELRKNYAEIPDPADAHDTPTISEALLDAIRGLAIEENDNDPEHLFFIGLAYLGGIDVEENRERGVELITVAAEGNVPEAMEKLSLMYKNGEGVERDYEASARWLEKLAEYWEKAFRENGSEEYIKNYFSVLMDLENIWFVMQKLEPEKQVCGRMLAISEEMSAKYKSNDWKHAWGVACNKMGNICMAERNQQEALEWYKKGLEVSEELCREMRTPQSWRDLSVSYDKMGGICEDRNDLCGAREWYEKELEADKVQCRGNKSAETQYSLSVSYGRLGRICELEGKLSEAKDFYEKSLEIEEKLCCEDQNPEFQSALSISYKNLGNICIGQKNTEESRGWYEKALEIDLKLNRELGTVRSMQSLGYGYHCLGKLCEEERKSDEAREYHKKSMEIEEKLCRLAGTVKIRRDLSISYEQMGRNCRERKNYSEAKEWFEKSLKIREEIDRETGTLQAHRDLNISYRLMGDICEEENTLDQAFKWYEKSLKISETLSRDSGTVQAKRSLELDFQRMGNICEDEHKRGEAKRWYEKSCKIAEELNRNCDSVNFQNDLRISYNYLGNACKADGDLGEAKRWYEKSLRIAERISRKTRTANSAHSLAGAYFNLAVVDLNKYDRKLLKKAENIWRELSEQRPDVPEYAEWLQYTRDQMKKEDSSVGSASEEKRSGFFRRRQKN